MSEKDKKELGFDPDSNENEEITDLEEFDETDEFDESMELDEAVEMDESGEAKAPAKASKQQTKAVAKKKSSKPAEKKKSGNRLVRFFKDMRGEMKKVSWPTKKQTINNTGIVIGVVIVAGAFVWVFDGIAGSLITALINLAKSAIGG